jgi:hypothetical protein
VWSGLLSGAKWKSVITLAARDLLTTAVPKRVLRSEELDSLRQLAIRPIEKRWQSNVSMSDYLLTEVPSLWRRHPFLMAEARIAGLFFFSCYRSRRDTFGRLAAGEVFTFSATHGMPNLVFATGAIE